MKKTLFCLAIGILSFYVGNFANSLVYWENVKAPILPFEQNRLENTKAAKRENIVPTIASPTTFEFFSITEGDYDSQQNKGLWMYLYSTVENEKTIVSGDVRIGSKIYDIKKGSYFNPNTGELNFTTEKIGKTLYKFSGKIIQKNYKDGESVLKGKLERVKNNSVIEVTNHEFTFYYHVCSQ